MNKIHQI